MAVIGGDIFEFVLNRDVHGQRCLNVRRYVVKALVGPPIVDPQAVAIAVGGAFNSKIATALTNLATSATTFRYTKVQRIIPGPKPAMVLAGAFLPQGPFEATPALPSEVTGVLQLRTAYAGRKYQGRWFESGMKQSLNINGRPNTAAISNLQDLATALAEDISVNVNGSTYTFSPCLVPKQPAVNTWVYITNSSVNTEWRVQRRRQVGKGQ